MANTEHSLLTDPELHEPKGIDSATAGQVYFADGAGSGYWGEPTSLITSFDETDSYVTSFEIDSLSSYSRLYLELEHFEVTSPSPGSLPNPELLCQLYSTSGATYRESSYVGAIFSENSREASSTYKGFPLKRISNYQYGFGIFLIDFFNNASYPTYSQGITCGNNTSLLTTTTLPAATTFSTFGVYNTDEANEKIRLKQTDDGDFKVKGSLFGIKS